MVNNSQTHTMLVFLKLYDSIPKNYSLENLTSKSNKFLFG